MAPPTPTVTPIMMLLCIEVRPPPSSLDPPSPERPGVDTTTASELPTCVDPLPSVVVKNTVDVFVTGFAVVFLVVSESSAEVSVSESSSDEVDEAELVGSEVGALVIGPVLAEVVGVDSESELVVGVGVGVGVSEVVGPSAVVVGSSEVVVDEDSSVVVVLVDGSSLVETTLVSSLVDVS